jgi:hypothetical protein
MEVTMFCPNCRSEYVDGVVTCADCRTKLVATLPPFRPEENDVNDAFVTILETGSQPRLLTARSLLESAGIPCLVNGEGLQDLFGLGRVGLGYNQVTGPARLQVRADQEQVARELITNARLERIDDRDSDAE